MENALVIEGVVEHLIYRNNQNGYTVALLESKSEMLTVVGCMPFIKERDRVKLTGDWTTHAQYGPQFKILKCQRILPDTEEDLISYLSSGIIKGLGPVKAKRVVKHFGKEILNVLKNDPTRISEVKGFSLDSALRLGEQYCELIEMEELIAFLQDYDIKPMVATKIFQEYGSGVLEKIKADPYALALGDFGVSFVYADKIASDLNIDKDNSNRIMSGIQYELRVAAEKGHVFLYQDSLLKRANKLLYVDTDIIEPALWEMADNALVYLDENGERDRVYLAEYYEAECQIANDLYRISASVIPLDLKEIQRMIDDNNICPGITLAERQKLAISQVAENGVVVITGGPGTGKTTILKALISIFEKLDMPCLLAAPTGRASKRMAEATGINASTIHRLLEIRYTPEDDLTYFFKDRDNPLDADVIIIDEVSMVDVLLMSALVEAVPNGARLILVGDVDQLPSVGAGNVLKDIIVSKRIQYIALNEVFRQAQESMIVVNAHKINRGEHPVINQKDKDFYMIHLSDPNKVTEIISDLCSRRLPEAYGLDPFKDIQVLSPTRKGPTGIRSLNIALQHVINPAAPGIDEKEWNGFTFRVGDKLMQNRNNYNIEWTRTQPVYEEGTGVFNGDIGILISIDHHGSKMQICFDDDRVVWYSFDQLDELEPAYALTVHKSQGCEFPVVVIPICKVHNMLMFRNLLYTAVTRARKLVVLVGEERWLSQMVENNRETLRHTALTQRLDQVWREWDGLY